MGIKVTDIPCDGVKVLSVISKETNRILYEKCSVTDE